MGLPCAIREVPMGPLEGLNVIDPTHVMAGPTCILMLADMGADVIKMERMPDGDDSRRAIPPTVEGESAAFMMMNRNKRGMALDLTTEGGRRVLRRFCRMPMRPAATETRR
jgi:crotonobetainyl-CoA:carnitine CoA-transferase CaiB-like acyl-CoA transferase